MRILISLLIMAALAIPPSLRAEGDEPDKTKKTISGFVKDAETGEDLIGATI